MAKVKMSSFFYGGIAIICQKTKVFAEVLQKNR